MTDMNTTAPAKRPTLLTVICIISFIMGAWGIFGGIQSMTQDGDVVLQKAYEADAEARAQLGEQAEGLAGRLMDSAMEVTENSVKNAKPIGISGIAFSLLSLFGVWLMWNLRKNGFWLYLIASIAGIITHLYFLGGGMASLLALGVTGFFTLLFIILYAVNLKHMH